MLSLYPDDLTVMSLCPDDVTIAELIYDPILVLIRERRYQTQILAALVF